MYTCIKEILHYLKTNDTKKLQVKEMNPRMEKVQKATQTTVTTRTPDRVLLRLIFLIGISIFIHFH